ncbi:Transmembrane nucleoporin, partial [Dispira parvispora]
MSSRPTPNPQASRQSLGERLMATAQTIEFVWWLGHILTVVFGMLYVINLLTFSSVSSYYYKAYLGTLLSYALVIYKTHGQPQFNTGFLQRIGSDENVQYFFLAL